MIKIKNNIFNENRIVQMCINEKNNLEIDTDNGFPIVIKNATFDDIQWEYDRFKVEADKDGVIFANRILEKSIKNLEEENQELEDRINKAIEYIEKLFILEDDDVTYEFKNDEIKPLLKILKGGEEID